LPASASSSSFPGATRTVEWLSIGVRDLAVPDWRLSAAAPASGISQYGRRNRPSRKHLSAELFGRFWRRIGGPFGNYANPLPELNFVPISARLVGSRRTGATPEHGSCGQLHLIRQIFKTSTAS
jgi:hypothetical protein